MAKKVVSSLWNDVALRRSSGWDAYGMGRIPDEKHLLALEDVREAHTRRTAGVGETHSKAIGA